MTEKIVNCINNNYFCLVKQIDNNLLYLLLNKLEQRYKKIIFTDLDDNALQCQSCFFPESNIIFQTPDKIRNIFLEQDIIIINNSEIKNIYYHVIWHTWLENLNKNVKKLPKIIFLSQGPVLECLPFIFPDENIVNLKSDKKYNIKFGEEIYKKYDVNLEQISNNLHEEYIKNKNKRFLIIVPSLEIFRKLKSHLNHIGIEGNIISFNSLIAKRNIENIIKDSNDKTIIVSDHSCLSLAPLKKFDVIFDFCVKEVKNQRFYITKNEGLKVENMLVNNGVLYRLTTKNFYNNFDDLEIFDYADDYLLKIYLDFPNDDIFKQIVDEEKLEKIKEKLEKWNLMKGGKIISNIELMTLPLDISSNLFIYEWNKLEYPVFPAIVLCILMEKINNSWISDEEKSFPKYKEDDIISYYLMIANKLLEHIDNLEDYDKINTWCDKHGLNNNSIFVFVVNLKYIIKKYAPYYEIKCGVFDYKNVISKAKPLLRKIFYDKIYTTHNAFHHTYISPYGKLSKISKEFINDKDLIYPEKLIAFKVLINLHNNISHYIYSFLTLKN